MNVARISRALREVADALDDSPEPKRSSARVRAVRRKTPPPPAKVDDVTLARVRRVLREDGFVPGGNDDGDDR